MKDFTVEEVVEAWKSRFENDPECEHSLLNESYSITLILLRLIAEGQPVSAVRLAKQSDLSPDQIEDIFKQFKECGGEFDEQGNVVGAALTQNPTPHRFLVNGNELYAWCSLDAIFLPGLLEQTAEVRSMCPVTGEPIELTITPDGIDAASPEQAVLSITIPGISCYSGDSCAPNSTGPQSDACSQMYFFSSPEAAGLWLEGHPGVAIFTLDQAHRLARENWINRSRNPSTGGSAATLKNHSCCCL